MENNCIDIEKLVNIIRRLRSPDGCPWDKKQTSISLKPLLVEETAELLDAIDAKDDENIREELGDLLMHIVFHSQIAEEQNKFTLQDVIEEISEKMQRRHPHIFGENPRLKDPDQVVKLWEKIKAEEKKLKNKPVAQSILTGIPKNLPALERAEQIQNKAAEVGFDWKNEKDVFLKVEEEIAELKHAYEINDFANIEEEIGDLLFTLVNLCRFREKTSSSRLLHKTIDKFEKRFSYMEKIIEKNGKNFSDFNLEELEQIWQKSKYTQGY